MPDKSRWPTDSNLAGSSKGARKPHNHDQDYEVALRLQEYEDQGYRHAGSRELDIDESMGCLSVSNSRNPNAQNIPPAIQEDLDAVQDFIANVNKFPCYACRTSLGHAFSPERAYQKLLDAQKENKSASLSTVKCPTAHCGESTCLGCGKMPRKGNMCKSVGTYSVQWCCQKSRLLAVWVLLCKYDEVEIELQRKTNKKPARSGKQNKASADNGVGFTKEKKATFWGMSYQTIDTCMSDVVQPLMDLSQVDAQTDNLTHVLFALITKLLPLYPNESPIPGLYEMIELSLFQDRAAQLLRNDSIKDVSSRSALYRSLFEFVEKIGSNKDTRFLVTDDRFAKKKSPGLAVLSSPNRMDKGVGKGKEIASSRNLARDLVLFEVEKSKDSMSWSLMKCMKDLSTQASTLLKTARSGFGDQHGRNALDLARYIFHVYESLQKGIAKSECLPTGAETDSNSVWSSIHAANRVTFSTIILKNLCSHLKAEVAKFSDQSPRGRMQALTMEIADMTTSLPDGIFLKVEEGRPDIMKSLVTGSQGTPYENGLFEFDIICPMNYPHEPPRLRFINTDGGRISFNPHMFIDGQGTHPGSPQEMWQPGVSTILQVLVSIQSMLFKANPLEDGPDKSFGKRQNREYNSLIQAHTVRHALLDWLLIDDMRSGIWREVVRTYFSSHGEVIIAGVKKWASSNNLIRNYRDSGKGAAKATGYRPGGPAQDLLKQLIETISTTNYQRP